MCRSRLIRSLSRLKDCWQGTQQRVQRHEKYLERLMTEWQFYNAGSKKLSRFFRQIEELLPPTGQVPCTLQQLQDTIKDFNVRTFKYIDTALNTLGFISDVLVRQNRLIDHKCLWCFTSHSGLRSIYIFVKNFITRLWRQAGRFIPWQMRRHEHACRLNLMPSRRRGREAVTL